jgi:hypothetical protein
MKITKDRTNQIIEMLQDGHSLVHCCKSVGISRAGLYKRMNTDVELESAIRGAQARAAEKALEELDELYGDALHGRKKYDPNILRDYAHHVRWRVQKIIPERFGDQKNRAGVEVSDGTVRILWETD